MSVQRSSSLPDPDLPVVARRQSNRAVYLFAGGALIAALLLFQALEGRRTADTAPAVRASVADRAAATAPAPLLYIPPESATEDAVRSVVPMPQPLPVAQPQLPPQPQPQRLYQPMPPVPDYGPPPSYAQPAPQPSISTGPLMVVGNPSAQNGPPPSQAAQGQPQTSMQAPVRRPNGRIANPSGTVAQGTLIPAVLETGLDSSRPGQARALVSRSVRSFDGKAVLVPRGSRLYGEYRADATPGQRRALIQWTRLLLPDGVTVYLDSPVADPMGRAGVSGTVNTHFFERFAGSILQTGLNIGTGLATRQLYNDYPVVLALPGSQVGTGGGGAPNLVRDIPPTIKVKPGARISVFVAQDLEFGPAGQ